MKRASPGCLAATLVWAATLAVACGDPVQASIKDSLGPEANGVKPGPNHRPGQPCLVCHDGGEAPEFSIAGTVYVTPEAQRPLVDATVTIEDAEGKVFSVHSNCVGNFYTDPKRFTPVYPFRVWIAYGDAQIDMETRVHRDGSCASCHKPKAGPSSAGPIYLTDLPNPPETAVCP